MKSRAFHSKYFSDDFVQTLSIRESYGYIYYTYNTRMNWLGTYEIPDRTAIFEMSTESDPFTKEELIALKEKLQTAGKVIFVDGYIIIKNSEKYENHLTNKQLMRSAFSQWKQLPMKVQAAFIDFKPKTVVDTYMLYFSQFESMSNSSIQSSLPVGYSVDEVIRNKKEEISNKNKDIRNKKEERGSNLHFYPQSYPQSTQNSEISLVQEDLQ